MSPELRELRALLDATDSQTVGTSIRLPVTLRDAAALATGMGMGTSVTGLTVDALRTDLLLFAQQRALDEHYRRYPETEPTLADVARAMADLEGSPMAERPDLIDRAATEVGRSVPGATARDVLVFAAGMAAVAA